MKPKYSWHHLALYTASTEHGLGVFTSKKLNRDTIVARLGGHVITLEQEKNQKEDMRDICHQIDENFVFGPLDKSDIELTDRFNHSCSPNCGFKGQIFILTMRDIKKGEQLTFDYAMVLGPKTRYKLKCECGSNICRGSVSCNDWKIQKLQRAYKGYFQWYIEDKIVKSKARSSI